MARSTQLVGIIELDADPNLDACGDEDLGQTLRRLRSTWGQSERDLPTEPPLWDPSEGSVSGRVMVISADVGQLRCELQRELARLMDRLLLLDT